MPTTPSVSALATLSLIETPPPSLPHLESYSPFCLKVHRALRAAGLPYTRSPGGPALWKQHNPVGQVPVLLIGSRAVADSTDILRVIDEELAPGALVRSPEALLWEELADTSVNGFLVAARWADDDNWPRTREAYFGDMPAPLRALLPGRLRNNVVARLVGRDVWRAGPEACWRRFGELLDQLDARAPAVGYWLGAELSVADVALFGQLWSLRSPLTPAQQQTLERRSRLLAYLERVHAATSGAPALSRAA